MKPPALLAALLAAALTVPGCGGGEDEPAPGEGVLPADHAQLRVISGWVDALRHGDVEAAAGYFAVPSVAQNGTPPITLETHRDVVAFNRSLPCGARLVSARPLDGFIAATFRLTERPGGDCGSGAGALARTAFVIRDGKIRQWRRLPEPGEGLATGEPAVQA
jgi:hypothetical protein